MNPFAAVMGVGLLHGANLKVQNSWLDFVLVLPPTPPPLQHSNTPSAFHLAPFVPKNHLFLPPFHHLFPVFCLFFAERTQLTFFLTHSRLNSCAIFSWVRLVETLFYIKPSHWERRDATPQASHQGEPSGRERSRKRH